MEVAHAVVCWREQNMHGRIFVPGIEEKFRIIIEIWGITGASGSYASSECLCLLPFKYHTRNGIGNAMYLYANIVLFVLRYKKMAFLR